MEQSATSNSLVSNEFNILHQTEALRHQLMGSLSDSDLSYRLPGNNPSLGELCRESGQVHQSYIDSFKTFKQNFAYKSAELGIEGSVQRLSAWFKALDSELDAVLSALSDADIQQKIIDRGFPVPVSAQFHIFREALLIFYGKADVYLKALGKPLTQQWREWVG